jgi:hypothetical protein
MAGVPQAKPLIRIIARPNDGTRNTLTRGFSFFPIDHAIDRAALPLRLTG